MSLRKHPLSKSAGRHSPLQTATAVLPAGSALWRTGTTEVLTIDDLLRNVKTRQCARAIASGRDTPATPTTLPLVKLSG